MTENSDLDIKKQELLFTSNNNLDESTQTDEELIFNHVWNSNLIFKHINLKDLLLKTVNIRLYFIQNHNNKLNKW